MYHILFCCSDVDGFVRNLREARKVDDEKELLAIRVTVLESDMSKVKHQLAIT